MKERGNFMPAGKMILHILFGAGTFIGFWASVVVAVLAAFSIVAWSWLWLTLGVLVVSFILLLLNFYLIMRAGEDFVAFRK